MTSSVVQLSQLRPMLANIEVFAIRRRPTNSFSDTGAEEAAAKLIEHLMYLFELERRGALLASGPLDHNPRRVEGMCVVTAESRAHAEVIAQQEPFREAGWRINTVRAWRMNEGLLTGTVRGLLDQPSLSPIADHQAGGTA